MMNMVRGREGQQVAYALICLLCGMPIGCVLPVVIRDVPLLLKAGGIVSLLCSPSIREEIPVGSRKKQKKSKSDQWLEEFYVLDGYGSNQGKENEVIMSSPLADLMKNEKRKQQQQQQPHEFDFRSSQNLRVMVDLVCESASLGMEAMLLSSFLWHQFTDFQGANTGLPVVLKRLICAALIVRYLQIRGITLTETVVETLEGSQTLETIRGFLSSSLLPSTVVSWLNPPKKNEDNEDNEEVEEVEVEERNNVMEEEQVEASSIDKDNDYDESIHAVNSIKSDKIVHPHSNSNSIIDQNPKGGSSTRKKATKQGSLKKKKERRTLGVSSTTTS